MGRTEHSQENYSGLVKAKTVVTTKQTVTTFLPSMYVRFPLELDRSDTEFRDFALGQIVTINSIANTAIIKLHSSSDDTSKQIECSLELLCRCFILPNSSFTLTHTQEYGHILSRCNETWHTDNLIEYYVQIEGQKGVTRVHEGLITVENNMQDCDPIHQLLSYEFQNPVWKFPRDRVVDCSSELHNATFGIEELVGTRLMLLPHQAEVISRVLGDTTCRYLLADEVGLGKTIEACVILKGLLRRDPQIKTLIVTPSSLVHQWQNELNTKFWNNFPLLTMTKQLSLKNQISGYILSTDDLEWNDELWNVIRKEHWGLFIVDEAHHLHKSALLYQRVYILSKNIERTLILSATPIQKRIEEYLPLLALLDPTRYDRNNPTVFQQIVAVQALLRKRVVKLTRLLSEKIFDEDVAEEFEEELGSLLSKLEHDQGLLSLAKDFSNEMSDSDYGQNTARRIVAYLSENYRIERRVIRNRRTHLSNLLPKRDLRTNYCYQPTEIESEVLESLYEYLDFYTKDFPNHNLTTEYCRIWLHAASSSPDALLELLETRIAHLHEPRSLPFLQIDLTVPAPPRLEARRIEHVIEQAPILNNELEQFLSSLQWKIERWVKETNSLLEQAKIHDMRLSNTNRLTQTLNAIHKILTDTPTSKIIIFSSWLETLEVLYTTLEQRYGKMAITQFSSNITDDQLQINADLFQSYGSCRILLCDELGGEGRNFQIAQAIVHIDLPWTPAQIEQRIGRVDRIGRKGTVYSFIPFAKGTLEEDLFHIWQDAFELFTNSMSGMEIALEGIQKQLLDAIKYKSGARRGIHQLVETMTAHAASIREEVEEERYFEEAAVNTFRRNEFLDISNRFRDGHILRDACLRWANLAGLRTEQNTSGEIIIFNPKKFSLESMKKARFLRPPNMEKALHRSGRKNNLIIRGTFNRDIAVLYENLIFFAPGNDPWLDAIIENALEADRGRCCAIRRIVPGLKQDWRGFELLYSLSVDPRPLYQLGDDPIHLFRASGFLRTSTYNLFISETGERISKTGEIASNCKREYHRPQDIHLGKRDGNINQILLFKEDYPYEEWETIVTRVIRKANDVLAEELDDYMDEVANEAQKTYEQQADGLKAALQWHRDNAAEQFSWSIQEIENFEQISHALIEGIRHPLRRLESVCFWILEGEE